jgi:hypothetical protein
MRVGQKVKGIFKRKAHLLKDTSVYPKVSGLAAWSGNYKYTALCH